jgi:hypothetical protein
MPTLRMAAPIPSASSAVAILKGRIVSPRRKLRPLRGLRKPLSAQERPAHIRASLAVFLGGYRPRGEP